MNKKEYYTILEIIERLKKELEYWESKLKICENCIYFQTCVWKPNKILWCPKGILKHEIYKKIIVAHLQ